MTTLRERAARLAACLKNPSLLKKGETLIKLADLLQYAVDGEAERSEEMRRLNGPSGDGLRVIHRIRGGGKTTELIELVKKENGVLLTKFRSMADALVMTGKLKKNQVMTWDDARNERGGLLQLEPNRPIYVDDAEHIIHNFFKGHRVTGISLS